MHFLEYFYHKTLKYDLINRFSYKDTRHLPKLKKIILNLNCKTTELKSLASSLFALELITGQKGTLTTTKKPNILLKIRKGNPVGCKVTLRKTNMFKFFFKTLSVNFPKLKNFNGFTVTRKIQKKAFSYEIHDTFSFSELGEHYYLFHNLSNFNITIVTNCKNKKEIEFLLKSFQFPIKSFADITQLVECNLAKVKDEDSNSSICFLDKWSSGLRR